MFSGRRFTTRNPVKPKVRRYRGSPPIYYPYKRRRSSNWTDDEDEYEDEDEDSFIDDELETESHNNGEDNTSVSKSPHPLRFVYIVSQSNTDILATDKVPECIDKVISVHATKISANEAAKAHLREICGVRSSTDVEEMDGKAWERVEEYHEGVGVRGMFVGSMRSREKEGRGFVRVETQKWDISN